MLVVAHLGAAYGAQHIAGLDAPRFRRGAARSDRRDQHRMLVTADRRLDQRHSKRSARLLRKLHFP
eukprot:5386976-Prymnesium_polylepis.1